MILSGHEQIFGKEIGKRMHCRKWDNLCRSKCESGLEFRKLEAFNQALLGKQV